MEHGEALRRCEDRAARAKGRIRWLAALVGAWVLGWMSSPQAGLSDLRFRASGDFTWDDNVTRAPKGDTLNDGFATLSAGANLPLDLTPHSRLLLGATLGGDKFIRYSGLDRLFLSFQGELQYRASADYTEPIYAIFVRQSVDWYDSNLRDGYRTSIGVSIKKPVTDRIQLSSALAYNQRNARNTVFDTKDFSLRGNVDYWPSRRQTIYLGLEYRDGDSNTTARPDPDLAAIRSASVLDDVFTDVARNAYRIKSRTGILTLGYNFAVMQGQALDISYRGVYSRPKEQPPADTIYYIDNQIILSYLIRF